VDFAHGGSLFVRFTASNWCLVDAAFNWSERGHMHSVRESEFSLAKGCITAQTHAKCLNAIRGRVFANAQTANIVMFGLFAASGQWAVSEDHLRLRNQMRTFTELLQRCMRVEIPFLEEIKDLTLGTEIEEWLNRPYGPGSVTRNFTST
jgi:hypothetical protein